MQNESRYDDIFIFITICTVLQGQNGISLTTKYGICIT